MNGTRNNKDIGANPVPRYELIDKDGNSIGEVFETTHAAAAAGRLYFPDQKQDDSGPNEEPNGWYLALVGAK